MKLVSCYIAGFGKFVAQTLDLSQNLLFIKGDNGWGKTTLADFLESMLYGIDGGRSKAVQGNPRLKYEPWSGAKFGGSLTFIYEDKTYRVERTFGKTAGADTVTVYDENNMQCYRFGDRAERLGETVLGVDRESFKKTAYVPQSGIDGGGFSPAIKDKLTQLLSSTKQDHGARDAMETLDKAERALRAKRKPAKGKLDELDEKLDYVRAQKADSERAHRALEEKREDAKRKQARLEEVQSELAGMGAKLEEYARRNERYATRTARLEVENSLAKAREKLDTLQTFFGEVDPLALNTEGLEQGITEFYALKEELERLQVKQEEYTAKLREKESIETKLSASLETLDSYELLLDEQERVDRAGDRADRKNMKFAKKRVASATWILVIALSASFAGAILLGILLVLGIILLSLGIFGVLFALVQMLVYTKSGKRKKRGGFVDGEMEARYLRTVEEVEQLESALQKFPKTLEEEANALAQAMENKKGRREKLNVAILEFFANFRMEENYDYRAGLTLLKERVAEYTACAQAERAGEERLSTLPQDAFLEEEFSPADMQALATEKEGLEREKERLGGELGRAEAEMQTLEKVAVKRADCEAEEERLTAEKARLERRLSAIRYAKEMLLRARGNMATKYLDPAIKSMTRYARALGLDTLVGKVSLQAEGMPIAEDGGALRELGYYSAGMQDLFGLCLRFALAESIYPEGGLLIMDDPFVNLDDGKTELAKRLLYTLSAKYQILYLTCKQERSL